MGVNCNRGSVLLFKRRDSYVCNIQRLGSILIWLKNIGEEESGFDLLYKLFSALLRSYI